MSPQSICLHCYRQSVLKYRWPERSQYISSVVSVYVVQTSWYYSVSFRSRCLRDLYVIVGTLPWGYVYSCCTSLMDALYPEESNIKGCLQLRWYVWKSLFSSADVGYSLLCLLIHLSHVAHWHVLRGGYALRCSDENCVWLAICSYCSFFGDTGVNCHTFYLRIHSGVHV
jgi:hypothetical protein